jgi:hypothetical protein
MSASPDHRSLMAPALVLGGSYLVAIVLLGPLLGSSADASTAYRDHFASDGNRVRDIVGSLTLLVAAVALLWTVLRARSAGAPAILGDIVLAVAGLASAGLVVAAGLLLTVPATTTIGELTDDPGIDDAVQAGIAQAGTVMLMVAALLLGATAVLLAVLGRRRGAVGSWIVAAAWVTAVCSLLGFSVVLLLPFAVWAIAVAAVWRPVAP